MVFRRAIDTVPNWKSLNPEVTAANLPTDLSTMYDTECLLVSLKTNHW